MAITLINKKEVPPRHGFESGFERLPEWEILKSTFDSTGILPSEAIKIIMLDGASMGLLAVDSAKAFAGFIRRYCGFHNLPYIVQTARETIFVYQETRQTRKRRFTVILNAIGANKISVIKAVREVTSLGLKEAKDLVDAAPKPIQEGISKEAAEAIRKKFVEAGATVEVR